MTKNNLFLTIDKTGNILRDSQKIEDTDQIKEILSNLYVDKFKRILSKYKNKDIVIEAYDEPLVISSVSSTDSTVWKGTAQFDHPIEFDLKRLTLDEWDRFHGMSTLETPFIFSDSAQEDLFNSLDSFDDDSITYKNEVIPVKNWLNKDPNRNVDEGSFWSGVYQTQDRPGWELQEPSNALVDTLNQIKLNKCRVAVLGSGSGHDAAHFAKLGHHVTAFDFSDEAIKQSKKKYGHLKNLEFVQKDVFAVVKDYKNSFDLVFEHTCYCAVNPDRRNELTKIWSDLLDEKGHFLGVMFTLSKPDGPPFGGSEWEINKRLAKYFNFRYWTRWRHSVESRMGFELLVYGEKK